MGSSREHKAYGEDAEGERGWRESGVRAQSDGDDSADGLCVGGERVNGVEQDQFESHDAACRRHRQTTGHANIAARDPLHREEGLFNKARRLGLGAQCAAEPVYMFQDAPSSRPTSMSLSSAEHLDQHETVCR